MTDAETFARHITDLIDQAEAATDQIKQLINDAASVGFPVRAAIQTLSEYAEDLNLAALRMEEDLR